MLKTEQETGVTLHTKLKFYLAMITRTGYMKDKIFVPFVYHFFRGLRKAKFMLD